MLITITTRGVTTQVNNYPLKLGVNIFRTNAAATSHYSYVHTQDVSSTTWTIEHNQNRRPPVVFVDSAGTEIFPGVVYTDANTITATFNPAKTGKAYIQ